MIGFGANLAAIPAAFAGALNTGYASGADLEFLFAERGSLVAAAGNALISCTRSGATATCFNRSGVLETVPANTPRLNFDPAVLRFENWIRYSEDFTNAVWIEASGTGLSTVSPNSALAPNLTLTADTITDADTGNRLGRLQNMACPNDSLTRTFKIHVLKTTGATTFPGVQMQFNGAGTLVTGAVTVNTNTGVLTDRTSFSPAAKSITSDGDYWLVTISLANNSTGNLQVSCYIYAAVNTDASGSWGNTTTGSVTVWGAQLNDGSTALSYSKTEATAKAKEYACRGLLVEESRVNSIRNNTMVGAVAGTPGTLPTNWTLNLATGLSQQVVGTGTSDGISYVDIRVSGTASASGQINLGFEGGTVQACSIGQVWTLSAYVALVGGTLTGTAFRMTIDQMSSGGFFVTGGPDLSFTPTSAALNLQRTAATNVAISNGSSAYVRPVVYCSISNGAVVDVTLRIGMPQLELGTFATSVIPTTSAAVTRNADVVTVGGVTSWWNATEGTIVSTSTATNQTVSNFPRVWDASDGTNTNFLQVVMWSSADTIFGEVYAGSHTFTTGNEFGSYTGARTKIAMAYKANDTAIAKDGACNSTDTSVALPSGINKMSLGADAVANSGTFLNGHIERWAYFRTRQDNTYLAALTA